MRHNQSPNQTSRHSPRSSPHILLLSFRILERHIKRLPETLPQEMRSSALQGPSILHESLDRECLLSSGESLRWAFGTLYDRHGEEVFAEFRVLVEHGFGVVKGTFGGGVGGVAFLPKEFGGAEERTGAHFPSHDVGPLVYFEGEITVTNNPLLKHIPNHSLRSRPDNQRILQFRLRIGNQTFLPTWIRRQTMMSDHSTLLSKSIHMFCLLRQKTLRNQKGEIGIVSSMVFNSGIEVVSDLVPDGHSPRFDDHASSDGRNLGKVADTDDVIVPFGVVFRSRGDEV
mmetsp:Transcript_20005/g.41065  ORF Transcript_20005/g.41065 Transcript_20005/m.41065 type:complete len:285 (-) Transcript_20005:676-1530(-)